MPREKYIGKDKIVEVSLFIVQTEGISNLNARKIAGYLNCSTQPIYSEFKNMNELKDILKIEAENKYRECVAYYANSNVYSSYLSVGMGYVKFAKEHKGLFNYLYMQPQGRNDLMNDDVNLEQIKSILMNAYHLSEEQALNYHSEMAVYTYGLACALNLDQINSTEAEIAKRLTNQFNALMALYKKEKVN